VTQHPQTYPLEPIGIHVLLDAEFPQRRVIMEPWLPEKGLTMLYAPRGVGKTWVALNIAWAVASGGSFLTWHVPKAAKVLYVDGEMPAADLQKRLACIEKEAGRPCASPHHLLILSSDLAHNGLPDLSTVAGQAVLDAHLADCQLIILDNLSTLCRSGRENEADSWALFQNWLLAKRREGRSVLLVHHAGKNGGQRGTSKREDVLDTVIALKREENYEAKMGARFKIIFEKTRGFAGAAAESIIVGYEEGRWAMHSGGMSQVAQVAVLLKAGKSQREIAGALGISLGKVSYLSKEAKETQQEGVHLFNDAAHEQLNAPNHPPQTQPPPADPHPPTHTHPKPT
jgi:AAA domain